jgi:hypothetical protein
MRLFLDVPLHQRLPVEAGPEPIRPWIGNCLKGCIWLVIPVTVTSLALGLFLFLPLG